MNFSKFIARKYLNLLPYELRRARFARTNPKQFEQFQCLRKKVVDGYSFKPFDETQSIFIHIPKAAGISICTALYGNLAGGHTNINQYKLIFPKQEFHQYFKFSFVRNPWDRLFSAYYFLQQGGINEDDRQWAAKNLKNIESFEQFVLEWLTPESIYSYKHLLPQIDMITSRNRRKIALNFLGFYENLDEDFERIKTMVNPAGELEHANRTESPFSHYAESFSGAMIDKVAQVYRMDIEALQYDFDNSAITRQLKLRDAMIMYPAKQSANTSLHWQPAKPKN